MQFHTWILQYNERVCTTASAPNFSVCRILHYTSTQWESLVNFDRASNSLRLAECLMGQQECAVKDAIDTVQLWCSVTRCRRCVTYCRRHHYHCLLTVQMTWPLGSVCSVHHPITQNTHITSVNASSTSYSNWFLISKISHLL